MLEVTVGTEDRLLVKCLTYRRPNEVLGGTLSTTTAWREAFCEGGTAVRVA